MASQRTLRVGTLKTEDNARSCANLHSKDGDHAEEDEEAPHGGGRGEEGGAKAQLLPNARAEHLLQRQALLLRQDQLVFLNVTQLIFKLSAGGGVRCGWRGEKEAGKGRLEPNMCAGSRAHARAPSNMLKCERMVDAR